MPWKNQNEGIPDFKTYLFSKEAVYLRLSLALIFLFFAFSWVKSDNILILFVKRATTLLFTFLVPGYLITKAIYPKNQIDVIERFAFTVAFSLSFVMTTSYFLNYSTIRHNSLAVATFMLAVIISFIAAKRSYLVFRENPDSTEKKECSLRGELIPLALLSLIAFLIKIYRPLTEPRAGHVDPYLFSIYTQSIISKGAALTTQFPFSWGYVPGYFFVLAFLKFFMDTGIYEVMRYANVFSFLTVIPAYLFARHVFKSRQVALLAATFLFSTRWMFMRTSISNPESMSHFFVILFLFMLLKTLESPTVKNCLVTSLLLFSTVLEYHMPLQFLVPFITIFIIFLGIRHYFTKTGANFSGIVKMASLITVPAILASGFLWYFWILDRLFYGLSVSEYITKRGVSSELLLDNNLYVGLAYHVRYIGLFEVILLCAGLVLIFLHVEQRKNIRYQFLLVYFATLLLLIQSRFFGIKHLHIPYLLSWLAFPASMLAAYGLFTSIKALHSRLIEPKIKIPSPKIFFVLAITLILVVNFNGFNYHWYKHDLSKTYRYDKTLILDPGTFSSMQKSVNSTGLLSSYLYRDYYGFYYPISITNPEYRAFKEIREHSRRRSTILIWKCKNVFMRGISERDAGLLENFAIKPDYDSMQIRKEILRLDIKYKSGFADRFMPVGFESEFPYGTCPVFSSETLKSLEEDENFKLVYQNEQIKIYKILTKEHTVFLEGPGGFRDDFEDLFYWGTNLNERSALRLKNGLANYEALINSQPIDVDFSPGLDTSLYPYFEIRMKVDTGKIQIGVYKSNGKVLWFLRNHTTSGEWETYKFNLYDWLTAMEVDTEIYGIRITNHLRGDPAFKSTFDWISIHNHIFYDSFEDETKIAKVDGIAIVDGNAELSKKPIEIIQNGGFESGFEGWRPQAKWSIDSTSFHSGNKSAILQGSPVKVETDASVLLDSEIYSGILKPNTTYRLSAWVKGTVKDAVSTSVSQIGSTNLWSKWILFTQPNKTYENWTFSEGLITTPSDVNGDFYIRIFGGGNPAVWFDDFSFEEEVYRPSGVFTSLTTIIENPVVSVTPSWRSFEHENANMTIEISVDNGTTWKFAKNGMPLNYTFDKSNRFLKYRAIFQTNDVHKSPILRDITLVYEEKFSEK